MRRVRVRRELALLLSPLVVAGALTLGGGASAATTVPYTDPDAVGSIGLCNQAGQQITSGNITAVPFAWRAVSTEPAQAPYNNAGRTATLVVYQPLQGLPPGDWSGAQLTSSSRYSNAANPMAAATDRDQSLEDIIEQYQPKWDGFLQLRIYLGTADEPTYTSHYPALNIQVTGNAWQAVGGSAVNCASGTSESIESILLPSTTSSTAAPTSGTGTSATHQGASGGAAQASDGDPSVRAGATSGSALASSAPPSATAGESSDLPLVLAVALGVLALLAASVVLLLRRRRPAAAPAISSEADLGASHSPTRRPMKGDTQ